MSKIFWPNAASRCPTKRSGCGASRSVQHTLAGSSVDRAGWATSGTWTRSSSPSRGQRRYLWRAVDQDGDVLDILVQSRRDCQAAKHFFRKLLKGQESKPRAIGHRQAEQLQGCAPSGHAVRRSQYGPIREQSRRSLAPAHTATRATHATVQISRSGTTLLDRARTRPQPLPRWPSPGASGASSRATRSLFPHLGCSHARRLT